MMTEKQRHVVAEFFKLLDGLVMAVAFTATWLYVEAGADLGLETLLELPGTVARQQLTVTNFLLFSLLVLGWHLTHSALGLYASRRLTSRLGELVDVVKATSFGSLVLLAASVLFGIERVYDGGLFIVVFWAVSTTATLGFRLLARSVLERVRRQGHNIRNVLVIGTNERAWAYALKVRSRPELGYHLLGFVDDPWPGLEELLAKGGEVVASYDELPRYLRENVVDEIVLAMPFSSYYPHGKKIIALCEEQGVMVRLPSEVLSMSLARARVDSFQGEAVITLKTGAMDDGWALAAKRLLDFTVSLVLLVALAPLLLAAALLVKLTSPGPVFFVQERVGLGKRRFKLYKFRTMVVDAEERLEALEDKNEVTGPVFKIAHDPRITPIGRFLRKTSIDELPQLLNVLQGHMSLVGPRPLPMRDYAGFSEDWQRRRFSVRPGLTCTWQVSGRSGIPFERWMEMDLEYIDQWSFWLDLKILLRTIPAVLRGTGAA